MKNAYKILVQKTKRKSPCGRQRQKWHDYLNKTYKVSEVGSVSVFKKNENLPTRHSLYLITSFFKLV
jgi:hypothetical protein